MLQALNILENVDLKAMGYNSARYIHTLYQAMNLAFADRDFYYGDPYFPPEEPIAGPAVEGLRDGALRPDRLGAERPRRQAGRSLPLPGRREPVPASCSSGGAPRDRRRGARPGTTGRSATRLPSRHDVDPGGRRRGLGRLGDAERRLDAGGDRRAHRRRPEPAHAELRAPTPRRTRSTSSSRASGRAPR